MSKKSLAVLASVLATMVFAALPAMSQAQTVQVGGESAGGQAIQALSSNLVMQTEGFSVECETSDLSFFMQNSTEGDLLGGGFGSGEEGCASSLPGVKVDIDINGGMGWKVAFEEEETGSITSSKDIQIKLQLQVLKKLVGSCHFKLPKLPFAYNDDGNPLNLVIEGAEFELTEEEAGENLPGCDKTMVLHGEFAVTSGGGEVTVDP